MATSYKILAQSNPSVAVLTTLYTVPSSTSTTCSSVVICNQGSVDATFRVSCAIAGASDTVPQYLYYNMTISAYDTFIATIGITLATTDVVRCYASTSNLSFNLMGAEIT